MLRRTSKTLVIVRNIYILRDTRKLSHYEKIEKERKLGISIIYAEIASNNDSSYYITFEMCKF